MVFIGLRFDVAKWKLNQHVPSLPTLVGTQGGPMTPAEPHDVAVPLYICVRNLKSILGAVRDAAQGTT